eukprot:1153699-Pelagomonas_calceolata.AAC.8
MSRWLPHATYATQRNICHDGCHMPHGMTHSTTHRTGCRTLQDDLCSSMPNKIHRHTTLKVQARQMQTKPLIEVPGSLRFEAQLKSLARSSFDVCCRDPASDPVFHGFILHLETWSH